MKFLSLLTVLLCLSCNPGPVKIIDSSKDCDQQSSSKIITSGAMVTQVIGNCEDLTQYKCEVREFSPTLATEIKKSAEFCPEDGTACLRYDHYIFDTSEQKQTDEYASAEDFEKDGQYNHQEARCWNQYK